MAIKAESVEQFSLEVIFPSSNYEAAMPELHKAHWLLQKFLQIFLHWCLYSEHSSGKTSGEYGLMGSPTAWDHRHGVALPCSTTVIFVFAICHSSERQTHIKKRIHFEGYSFQMFAWRLQLSLSFLLVPIRPMQRSFVALMKTIWMRRKQNWRKWLASWTTSPLRRLNSRVRMVCAYLAQIDCFPGIYQGHLCTASVRCVVQWHLLWRW